MVDSVMMSELTWYEYKERVDRGDQIVILPFGALEQHGPHLPMGTDNIIPTRIAARVAELTGAVVAPCISYGYKSQPKSGGGNEFPGTTSLDAASLISISGDIIRELARHGVRRVVVMNWHMENAWHLVEGIDLALRGLRAEGINDLKVQRIEAYDFVSEETLAEIFKDETANLALEHAAVMESSLILYLCPELVHSDLIPDGKQANFPAYDVYPIKEEWVPETGVLRSAKIASAEFGKKLYEEYTDTIARAVLAEFPKLS